MIKLILQFRPKLLAPHRMCWFLSKTHTLRFYDEINKPFSIAGVIFNNTTATTIGKQLANLPQNITKMLWEVKTTWSSIGTPHKCQCVKAHFSLLKSSANVVRRQL